MATLTTDEILDAIAGMTVLELSELKTAFEERFDVTAAAPVAVAAAASVTCARRDCAIASAVSAVSAAIVARIVLAAGSQRRIGTAVADRFDIPSLRLKACLHLRLSKCEMAIAGAIDQCL